MSTGKHCATCTCDEYLPSTLRRAPVQANVQLMRPAGSISWDEHLEAWGHYAARHGRDQSAERIAERGGFCYGELLDILGRQPRSWLPR